jgi:hypothetical protein
MLHACLCTICFVFCYTSWCFYAFSGTNVLTRYHSASSLFSAVFVFQKSYTENIFEIGRNEGRTSYFSRHETKSEGEPEGARGPPHHLVARVTPRARHSMVCGPWLPFDIAPPPIKSLRRKNPKSIGVFPNKVPQRRRRQRPISGDRSLYSGTLPGRGSAPGAISIVSIDFTAISINVAVSHDEEGVVLPRG